MSNKILEVVSVSKSYPIYSDLLHIEISKKTVLKNISFILEENKTLGILGPSGVGKTTLVKIISKIEKPDEGYVYIDGKEVRSYSIKEFVSKVQILFQNPYSMLNPKLKVGYLLKERILQYFKLRKQNPTFGNINYMIEELLGVAKLSKFVLDMYPYQLSGGQRQRIALLMVLSLRPKILILDEPLSAMDVSLQAQMLNFLNDIKEKYKFSYLFITHDKDVAEYFCDKILTLHEDGSYDVKET